MFYCVVAILYLITLGVTSCDTSQALVDAVTYLVKFEDTVI